jgi:UDP-perosamine 4-acetyltransferase
MNKPKIQCVVLGGGGHAKVVIDALQECGIPLRGILDPRTDLHGTVVMGVPVLGGDDLLASLKAEGSTSFVLGLGSVGRNPNRQSLFELGLQAGLSPQTVIHPAAVCSKFSSIGEGAVVFANAVINAGARIGINAIVNTGAIVEHDCSLGDHAHIASGARMSGNVHIGSGAFVGAGATIKQGVSIGRGAVIGAGSLVLRDVPADVTVVGVPAREIESR